MKIKIYEEQLNSKYEVVGEVELEQVADLFYKDNNYILFEFKEWNDIIIIKSLPWDFLDIMETHYRFSSVYITAIDKKTVIRLKDKR